MSLSNLLKGACTFFAINGPNLQEMSISALERWIMKEEDLIKYESSPLKLGVRFSMMLSSTYKTIDISQCQVSWIDDIRSNSTKNTVIVYLFKVPK